MIQRMNIHQKLEIVSACSDGNAIFYKLDSDSGELQELARIKADFPEPETATCNDVRLNA